MRPISWTKDWLDAIAGDLFELYDIRYTFLHGARTSQSPFSLRMRSLPLRLSNNYTVFDAVRAQRPRRDDKNKNQRAR